MEAREGTLSALLARAAARAPDAPAVTEGATTLDWRGFERAVESLAGQLARAGVARSDSVAIRLPNSLRYLAAIFAVARLGAMTVHVNTRFGADEVASLLSRTRPLLTLAEASAWRDLGVTFDGKVLTTDDFDLDGDPAPDAPEPDDDCLVYTTGGTTAAPKLVCHKQRSIATHAAAVAARIGPVDAYLAAVPFCGTFGNIGALSAVAAGAHVVIQPQFDPHEAAALIRRHRISHAVGDDRMVARLAEAAGGMPFDTLRFFGAAAFGADARPALAAGVAAGVPVRAIYGSSEVQALFAIGRSEACGWGAVTPVDPAARVAVVDGELRLDGPSRFDRYLDDPAATAASDADGLFRTSDRATLDGDGFSFEGRMGDVLRLGGFLVAPAEIEAFLSAQPGVAEAQVVGVEADGRARAFAFAIPAVGAAIDEGALIAAASARLARYKVPARVVALDAFPTSTGPNGPKISRAALRTMAAAHMEARP